MKRSQRSPLKRARAKREGVPAHWRQGVRWYPCEACGERSVHAHHIIYEQHCRKHGAPVYDVRNRMLLCFNCHGQHHARRKVLRIPDDHPVWEFAAEHNLAWLVERTYWHEEDAA